MKNRVTYLLSSALGILFHFMFHAEAWYVPVVFTAVSWIEAFCSTGFLVVVALTLSAAVSSFLGHRDIGTGVCLTTVLWGLVSGFALCLAAGLLFLVLPDVPVVTAQTGGTELVFPDRFFVVFAGALLFGFAFRPTSKVFKEAYSLSNSLSEAAFRFCKDFSRIWWIAMFFFAANTASVLQSNASAVLVPTLAIAAVSVLAVLPILFCIFTKFRVNPYRKMFRLVPPALSAFFGQTAEAGFVPLYCAERNNLGIQKRVVALTAPLSRMTGRGGSAAFAVYAICYSVYSSGSSVGFGTVLLVAAVCTCAGFVAFCAPGAEMLAICSVAFFLLGKEPSAVAVLPLLAPFSALTDILIAGLCSVVIGKNFDADCEICSWDTV